MSNYCVTNPIDSSQVININVDWGDITPPTCLSLNDSLQAILTSLNNHYNRQYTLNCITPIANNTEDVLQALIDYTCGLTLTTTTTVEQGSLTLDLSLQDTFDCNANSTIVVTTCGATATFEEQIQALTSRIVTLSEMLKTKCTEIDTLNAQVAQLQLDVTACCP